MARQISELQSLPFHQIIGAPLLALFQGQAQAAQATAEFIDRIGFKKKENTNTESPENEDELGDLRMITFNFQRADADGVLQTHKMEIPLLSIVPIPAIEIKNADLEFNIKVTDIQSEKISTSLSSEGGEEGDWLSTDRVQFRAAMGRMETSVSDQRSVDLQMKVKINVQQADIAPGMAHLYRLMDQSFKSSIEIEEEESEE